MQVGKDAIGAFLLKLNVYKATADVQAGSEMYSKYSDVSPEMLELRQAVLEVKQPRKLFVQPTTLLADGTVTLKEYSPSPEGMISSFVDRFADDGPLAGLVEELAKCGQFPYGQGN
jgi:dipeptidyl-peptidase-3